MIQAVSYRMQPLDDRNPSKWDKWKAREKRLIKLLQSGTLNGETDQYEQMLQACRDRIDQLCGLGDRPEPKRALWTDAKPDAPAYVSYNADDRNAINQQSHLRINTIRTRLRRQRVRNIRLNILEEAYRTDEADDFADLLGTEYSFEHYVLRRS